MEDKIERTEFKTIAVPMPIEMAESLERLCRERGLTMSAVIKMLVWNWIKKEEKVEEK